LASFVSNEASPKGGDDQTVFVRIAGDIVQASVDATGELLHRRGYRTYVGTAPLRETLAAALARMLAEKNVKPDCLWDPFCGSGCVPLEWLQFWLGAPADGDRTFAFEQWPTHDAETYRQWLDSRPEKPPLPLTVFGSDIDQAAIDSATSNATRCSLDHSCNWMVGDFESFVDRIPPGTPILTNPPYGIRLGGKDSYVRLMRRFEDMLARRTDLRPVVMLVPMPTRPWQPNLDWRSVCTFHNGGLPVQALRLGEPNI
jgi:putative N6-adenine-specific DNA methylase